MTDLYVDAHDGIRLAVRDHGGDGTPMVLMHGAGAHLESLEHLTSFLQPTFRVVSMDVRWCGWSGDSPTYDWADLVRDVESVRDALDLGNPVVAGHSWGGMIAARYGVEHPDAPAVINLDGHGEGNRSMYDGVTDEEIEIGLAAIDAINEAFTPSDQAGDDEWHATAHAESVERYRAMRVPDDRLAAFADRSFARRDDGTWAARPSPVMMTGLRGDLRLLDVYAGVRCPLLVLNCTRTQRGMPPEVDHLMQAYRRGLGRQLDELAAAHPNIEIAHLEHVDHQSIVGRHAEEIAELVQRFVAR